MDNLNISKSAFKDYCFDLNEENEIIGPSIRQNNPKKLVQEINLEDLYSGKEVVFEVVKNYEETILEEEDPDVFNEIIYNSPKLLREKRGAPPLDCSFESLAKGMIDIIENGYVKKQTISNGIGVIVPENSLVIVHYNLYKENCEMPFDSTYLRNKAEKFRLDKGETILGLSIAVKTMKKKENSRFFIKWEYAYGALGCPDRIEPKCDIVADITLVNFIEINSEKLVSNLTEEKIFKESMNEVKHHLLNGSEEYNKKEFTTSINCYRKALKILNNLRLADEEEEEAMLKLKVKCLVNLAVTYNKIKKFEHACLACQDALYIDCNNVKACFHYGRAALGLSNFSASKMWLLKAAKLKPFDEDISKELKKLDDKKKFHKLLEKDFWGKALENKQNNQKCSKQKETNNEESFDLKLFETDLKERLIEECIIKGQICSFSESLSCEKKEICLKLANIMNLKFSQNGDLNIFELKTTKS